MNISLQPLAQEKNPWILLIVTLAAVTVGFQFIGAFFGIIAVMPFYDGSLMDFIQAAESPVGNDSMRVPLLIMQGTASLTGFILVPILLFRFYYRENTNFFPSPTINQLPILLTLVLVPMFMMVNAPVIEWNQNFTFPESMAGLESKFKAMEDLLRETSEFITRFDSTGQLLLGLVVVAIIPGIGEELVFRGLIQNNVLRITGNIHVAIWLAALLFSMFHLQFYGLVPRMLLGALFGYLYYFSGNLIYPMVAHFMNNGFTLIMLHLYNIGVVELDIESTDSLPWYQVGFGVLITALILISFKKSFELKKPNAELG